jgi:hypothetical protein
MVHFQDRLAPAVGRKSRIRPAAAAKEKCHQGSQEKCKQGAPKNAGKGLEKKWIQNL